MLCNNEFIRFKIQIVTICDSQLRTPLRGPVVSVRRGEIPPYCAFWIEMAAVLVVFSIDKAVISTEIRSKRMQKEPEFCRAHWV